MSKIPQIKKKVHTFLIKEEGKISKEQLLKTGIFLTAISLASIKASAAHSNHSNHSNALGITYADPTVTGTHNHSHASHNSHSSHGSHGQW